MESSTQAEAGGVVRVSVTGEIDMATAEDLRRVMTAAIEGEGVTRIVVDLGAVTFCDSSGLAALDRAYAMAAGRGVALRLVEVQPPVRRVLEIVGMAQVLLDHGRPQI